jgi:hypothetical protein
MTTYRWRMGRTVLAPGRRHQGSRLERTGGTPTAGRRQAGPSSGPSPASAGVGAGTSRAAGDPAGPWAAPCPGRGLAVATVRDDEEG